MNPVPEQTALLIVDMQNDFLHARGAYGRAGQTCEDIAALSTRLAPLAGTMRAAGGTIISTQFTLVPGKGGAPLIPDHLRRLRPFLGKGDFAPGCWGHRLIDALAPADLVVEKVAYSAFYQTRLEYCLRRMGIETLMICGIVTNGGVASTLRSAHTRDFHTILLHDGCAAFDIDVHRVTIESLSSITRVVSCAQAIEMLERP